MVKAKNIRPFTVTVDGVGNVPAGETFDAPPGFEPTAAVILIVDSTPPSKTKPKKTRKRPVHIEKRGDSQ